MDLQQDQKGLFTFYRQQAELEEQYRKRKKQLKELKKKEKEDKEKEKLQAIEKQKQLEELRQIQLQKIRQKIRTERKLLYEPRYKGEKYEKKKIGQSVIVVNSKKIIEERSIVPKKPKVDKDGRFIQNKEVEFDQEEEQNRKSIPLNYYNSYQEGSEYVPETKKRRKRISETVFPKLQKSKKLEMALKSGNSDIIRRVRESIKDESKQEKISFINYTKEIYQQKPIVPLNPHQKKLIQILRKKRYYD